MPGFQFELSQLVNVPGKDQQGRISGRMEFVNEETLFQIKWLLPDLSIAVGMFSDTEVTQAQLPAAPVWLPEVSFRAAANDDAPAAKPRRKRRPASKRKSRK